MAKLLGKPLHVYLRERRNKHLRERKPLIEAAAAAIKALYPKWLDTLYPLGHHKHWWERGRIANCYDYRKDMYMFAVYPKAEVIQR